jgi:outer membrane protein OmpA-like peptidoglycan-associated protein
MSKRDNPFVLPLVLAVTFGLSIAGIWWAHQFGFASNSSIENISEITTENTYPSGTTTPTVTPTATPTPKRLKTAADIEKSPVKGQVRFIKESFYITEEAKPTLDQLAKQITKFAPEKVAIRVVSYPTPYGDTEYNLNISQKRAEEVAAYLRDRGLRHKIIAVGKDKTQPLPNFSPEDSRNQRTEISLVRVK